MAGGGGNTPWERLEYLQTLETESLCKAIEMTAESEPSWMYELQGLSLEDTDADEILHLLDDIVSENGWHVESLVHLPSEEWEILVKGNGGDSVSLPSLRNERIEKQHLIDFILAMEEIYGCQISAH